MKEDLDDIDDGGREDIEWEDRSRRMEQIERLLRDSYPELDKLALINWLEDWLFTQNEVEDYDYQVSCYRRALQMFDFTRPIERDPADFGEFIKPAIKAFFEKEGVSDAAKVAIIVAVLEL